MNFELHHTSPPRGHERIGSMNGRAVSDDFGVRSVESGCALNPKHRQRGQPRGARWEKVAMKQGARFKVK